MTLGMLLPSGPATHLQGTSMQALSDPLMVAWWPQGATPRTLLTKKLLVPSCTDTTHCRRGQRDGRGEGWAEDDVEVHVASTPVWMASGACGHTLAYIRPFTPVPVQIDAVAVSLG